MANQKDRADDFTLIQTLAKAVSTQVGVANRRWLALMTVAVVALLPRDSAGENFVDLPFGLGKVDPSNFYFVAFLMLLVLTIGFTAAHAQSFRANTLAQETIDKIAGDDQRDERIPMRDVYDMLRLAGVTQVSPLSRLLISEGPTWRRWVGAVYYLLLKTISFVVYYGFPATALYKVYYRVEVTGAQSYLLTTGGVVASVALLQIFLFDFRFMLKIFRIIGTGQDR